MEKLTAADFEPYLKQEFKVELEDGSLYPLELIEVSEMGAARSAQLRRPFSLLFRSPRRDAYLPQRTYRLEFERLPGSPLGEAAADRQTAALEVFMVPLGPQVDGMSYQVIFA